MPGPCSYETKGSLVLNKKSSLSKSPRVTIPAEIEHQAKRLTMPGPGAYDYKPKYKVLGSCILKSEKRCFLDEAEYMGLQTPQVYDAKYDSVFARSPKIKIISPKTKPEEQFKVVKSDKPDMGSYNSDVSFQKT